MNKRAHELIDLLELSPHPEGGYYREMYRSETKVFSPIRKGLRSALTDIYFLLVSGQISRFHRVMHDEVWHFYEGNPLELVEMQSEGFEVSKVIMGNNGNVPKYQHCIKGGNWQAAYSTGEYSLVGCTVAPGFDPLDFEFLKDNSIVQSAILKRNPELVDLT